MVVEELAAEVEALRGEVAALKAQSLAHVCAGAAPQPWQVQAWQTAGAAGAVPPVTVLPSQTFRMECSITAAGCAGAAAYPSFWTIPAGA